MLPVYADWSIWDGFRQGSKSTWPETLTMLHSLLAVGYNPGKAARICWFSFGPPPSAVNFSPLSTGCLLLIMLPCPHIASGCWSGSRSGSKPDVRLAEPAFLLLTIESQLLPLFNLQTAVTSWHRSDNTVPCYLLYPPGSLTSPVIHRLPFNLSMWFLVSCELKRKCQHHLHWYIS